MSDTHVTNGCAACVTCGQPWPDVPWSQPEPVEARLTDEQIEDIWAGCSEIDGADLDIREFARAIEAAANTSLISAAPDLLEALLMARQYVGVEGSDEEFDQVNAAIAKAAFDRVIEAQRSTVEMPCTA